MTSDFSRVITLLRKERGITQKQAAADLGVSQALLSHYEKGIRECGLDFVVRVADYYEVSCDYLLGRSTDRNGLTLNVEDLLDSETRSDSKYRGSVMAVMKKKFITNSINVLYDKLIASRHEGLMNEVSSYLMLAVYRMFRMLYSSNSRNFTFAQEVGAISVMTTASLDNQTACEVTDAILGLEGLTRIVVTHRLEPGLLERYDEIVVLHAGKIQERGRFQELMEQKGYFYSLYTVSR